jgi:hypothetical protein
MSRVIICINNVESFNGTISKELLSNFKQIINAGGCTDVDIDSVRGSNENPPRYFVFADMTEECVNSLISKGIISDSDIYTPEEIYPIIDSTIEICGVNDSDYASDYASDDKKSLCCIM